jgi:hypothetical protein
VAVIRAVFAFADNSGHMLASLWTVDHLVAPSYQIVARSSQGWWENDFRYPAIVYGLSPARSSTSMNSPQAKPHAC